MTALLHSVIRGTTVQGTGPAELLPLPGGLASLAGLPRGGISEIIGGRSSGRTALVHAILAESMARGEICAVVDWANSFDPATARGNGVALEKLLWVRCDHQPDRALKVADVLLHTGGFGVVALDLYDVPANILRRIPLSWWHRFRREIERTPGILLVAGSQSVAGSCASCVIEMEQRQTLWSGSEHVPVLAGIEAQGIPRKPREPNRAESVLFRASVAASLAG
jgi:hypothetical protein